MDTINLSFRYKPIQGIIIYQSGHTEQWSRGQYYLESHDIRLDENGAPILLEGKPLRKSTLVSLAKALSSQTTDHLKCRDILPSNLLYVNQEPGNNILIWYVPAKKHYLYFTEQLNIPNGEASVPTLIFVANENRLSIFATKTKGKPSLRTKLYKAPFHNVGDQGNICLGSGKRDKNRLQYFDEVMTSWEKVFWATEFSEIHGKPAGKNINLLWKHLISSDDKFPNDVLLPSPFITLEDLLKQKIR